MISAAVVILNYNGRDYLQKFLPGVIEHSAGYRIIVADNCSTDNSIQLLEDDFSEVEIIKIGSNKGYSHGYNEALSRITDVDYYILLNSDIEVTSNWITPVLKMMANDPTIAAAQPKILDYNNKSKFEYAGAAGGYIDVLGYPFCRGRLFLQLEEDTGQYDDNCQIFWATGACLFINSEVFHEVGGFDQDFFAHMEEIDLCWRINHANYKIYYNGESKVYHVGGGTLHKSNPKKTYLNFRNGLTLIYKNYNTSELFIKLPIRILLDIIATFKFMLFDSFQDGIAVIKAHIDFIKAYSLNRKKRKAISRKKALAKIPVIYRKSIVGEYFLKGRRKYSELPKIQ